jgi:flavin-binding protein dodecin
VDEVRDDVKDCVDEAAAEGEEAIDELEDEEVVDEYKVVDTAAEGYAE